MKSLWEWVLAALAIVLLIIVWNKRALTVAARTLETKPLNTLLFRR